MPIAPASGFRYDLAISYAGENSEVAGAFGDYFRGRGLKPFFAPFEQTRMLGEDMQLLFQSVFMKEAQAAIVIISSYYATKVWPLQEFAAIRAAILQRESTYLIPVRIDDSELPGLSPLIVYGDIRKQTPAEVGAVICEKFWPELVHQNAYEVASPWTPANMGTVRFNFRRFGGRYRIGSGPTLFETYWTGAGESSIHCYANQSESIRSIAMLPPSVPLSSIRDAALIGDHNRVETPEVGQSVILKNAQGLYAGLEIVHIAYVRNSTVGNELVFKFRILPDASRDFSESGKGTADWRV